MKLNMKTGLFQDISYSIVFGSKKTENGSTFLALFDLELNTIVSRELVDSETVYNVFNFLNQSLRNQKKECIITGLKPNIVLQLTD